MSRTESIARTPRLLACAFAGCTLAFAVADEQDIVPPPSDEVHSVKLGLLEIEWDGSLRLETNRSRPVKIGTDQYGRSAEVAEVLVRSGMVRKGDVILRLDKTDIDEAIEDATTALDEKKTQLEIATRNLGIEDEAM